MAGNVGNAESINIRTIKIDKETSTRPGRCYRCQRVLDQGRIVVSYYSMDSRKTQMRRYCGNLCLTQTGKVDSTKPWWRRLLNL